MAQSKDAMRLCTEACRTDDTSLMEQVISMVAQSGSSQLTVGKVIQCGLQRSASRSAVHVLRYVLGRGADVGSLSADHILRNDDVKPSQEVLQILVTNGWDINTQGPQNSSWPLLWHVVRDHNLVTWCLDHGAKVDIPTDPPSVCTDGTEYRSRLARPTILGTAAASGSIETFELLRARGAPLDPRTLHLAVEQAAVIAPRITSTGSSETSSKRPMYDDRIAMVRHLVDVVKLDVSAAAYQVGDNCSMPLCYLACRPQSQDTRELVYLLLNRGANLSLDGGSHGGIFFPSPFACAQFCKNSYFLEAVREWQNSSQYDDTNERFRSISQGGETE